MPATADWVALQPDAANAVGAEGSLALMTGIPDLTHATGGSPPATSANATSANITHTRPTSPTTATSNSAAPRVMPCAV